MSVEIPENMEEVAMKIAQYKVRGQKLTEAEVIATAVLDMLQDYLDEALEGRYDEVTLQDDGTLLVTDVMGEPVGEVKPLGKDWTADFKADVDALEERLANETRKIVGHR